MQQLPKLHWYGPGFEDVAEHPQGLDPTDIVVFSHGWGVKWPSKGLFTDLAKSFANNGVVSVLVDMNDFDESGNATFLPLAVQQDRVKALAAHTRSLFPSCRLVSVSHSLGTRVVTSISRELSQDIDAFVLLAPPLGMRAKKPKKRMLRHEGSYETPGGGIVYPRKDGTTSTVSKEFIQSFNQDWNMVFGRNLSTIDNKLIVLAEHDERTEEQEELLSSLGAKMLTDSDHNFTGDCTAELARMIELFIYKQEEQ